MNTILNYHQLDIKILSINLRQSLSNNSQFISFRSVSNENV